MSTSLGIALAERGLVPDRLVRLGIRRLLAARLRAGTDEAFVRGLGEGPIAPVPEKANEQHYEVPAAFFRHVLGRNRKYSSAFWTPDAKDLDAAEDAMLDLTCERARLADGQRILELGCGWGSLSLRMARRFPGARILAVSNSRRQKEAILEDAPGNLEVETADMNDFATTRRFDRVVSVEMFEHMRNYPRLLERIAGWLEPGGRLFVHVFCHREHAYPFETGGADNWMGRHFFTGGCMPSEDLLPRFQDHLALEEQWRVAGTHYARTAEAWLANLDRERAAVLPILAETYGAREAARWFHRWRIFFLACAELFGCRGGREWFVAHYRFVKPAA